MQKKADLHIHTTASDGVLPPKEVVRWAHMRRLAAIGITDHDTVNGIDEAIEAGDQYKLEIVPGIELSTEYEGEEIHILGYYIDYKAEWFLEKLEEIQNVRHSRAFKMIEKLNALGIQITIEQVEAIADSGTIGRPHIARAMIEKGYINNMKAAFDRYIGKDGPAYVPRYKLSSEEAVRMIKSLGGVPIMAHPGLIRNKKNIGKLLDMGIQGIEVYHSKHEADTIQNALIIVNARCLIATGGSDCHGFLYNNEPILGSISVDYNAVEQLKKASIHFKQCLEADKIGG